jgi:hypothetical protein
MIVIVGGAHPHTCGVQRQYHSRNVSPLQLQRFTPQVPASA